MGWERQDGMLRSRLIGVEYLITGDSWCFSLSAGIRVNWTFDAQLLTPLTLGMVAAVNDTRKRAKRPRNKKTKLCRVRRGTEFVDLPYDAALEQCSKAILNIKKRVSSSSRCVLDLMVLSSRLSEASTGMICPLLV